jgi:hypothetical protein
MIKSGNQSSLLLRCFIAQKPLTKKEDVTNERKIAQKKFTLLQAAETIRNIAEACRRHSVSRSQFYEYKQALKKGFDGLLDRPPVPKSFSQRETSRN